MKGVKLWVFYVKRMKKLGFSGRCKPSESLVHGQFHFFAQAKFQKAVECGQLDVALPIFDPRNKTLFCTDLFCQLLLSEISLVSFFPDQFSDHECFCLYLEFGTFFGSPSAVALAKVFFKRGNLFFCCQCVYLFVKYSLTLTK
jgi:hypothetical protein